MRRLLAPLLAVALSLSSCMHTRHVIITADNPDAAIYVDGTYLAKASAGKTVYATGTPLTIEARHPDYETRTTTLLPKKLKAPSPINIMGPLLLGAGVVSDLIGLATPTVYPDGSPNVTRLSLTANFVDGAAEGMAFVYPLGEASSGKPGALAFYKGGRREGPSLAFEGGRPLAIEEWKDGRKVSSLPYPAAGPVSGAPDLLYLSPTIVGGLAEGEGLALSLDLGRSQKGRFSRGLLVEGTRVEADGSVMSGIFQDGILVKGVWRHPDGSREEGIWISGRLASPATIAMADGTVYQGAHVEGRFEGQGILRTPGGDVYEGSFSGGLFSGKGSYAFSTGAVYKGDFVAGSFEGQGVLVKANGESFEGPFLKGFPHGSGIYKYQGSVERAEFYEGKRIDQAFMIRLENEKAAIAKALREEELARQRAAEEEARLAAARRAEFERQEEARRAQQAKSNKALLGVGLGLLTGGLVAGSGGNALEAVSVGVATVNDVMQGTLASPNSQLKATSATIVSARGGTPVASIGPTSSFLDSPTAKASVASPAGGPPAAGDIAGDWRSSNGEELHLGADGSYSLTQTKSINGNPGSMRSSGRYSYASGSLTLTITSLVLNYSGGTEKDPSITEKNPKVLTEKVSLSGGSLVFGGVSFRK